MKDWVNELHQKSNADQVIALVGNKTDLEVTRTVDKKEAEAYANSHNLLFFETSAKTGKNYEIWIFFFLIFGLAIATKWTGENVTEMFQTLGKLQHSK